MPTVTQYPTSAPPTRTGSTTATTPSGPAVVQTVPAPATGQAGTSVRLTTPRGPGTSKPKTAVPGTTGPSRPVAVHEPYEPPVLPPKPPFIPGEQDLRAALLTGGDLPPGFIPADAQGLGGSLAGCPLLANDPPGTTASANAVFSQAATVTTVSQSLLHVGDRTAEAMAAFDALPQVCARFEGTLSTMKLEFTTARATSPAIGDASVAVRLTISLPGGPALLAQDVVIVSHRGTIIVLSVISLTPPGDLLTAVVTRALDKVTARW
ncbi:hypothetical protein [Actinokineospora diospyrosa]|nr:hypothetical protein [Actinokineospora diospyrosa]